MSAETLHRAAALMRDRADGVDAVTRVNGGQEWWSADVLMAGDSVAFREDAEHIASWGPEVARVVADMIHEVGCAHYPMRAAEHLDPYGCATCFPSDGHWPCSAYADAIAVANAYLGGTP